MKISPYLFLTLRRAYLSCFACYSIIHMLKWFNVFQWPFSWMMLVRIFRNNLPRTFNCSYFFLAFFLWNFSDLFIYFRQAHMHTMKNQYTSKSMQKDRQAFWVYACLCAYDHFKRSKRMRRDEPVCLFVCTRTTFRQTRNLL